MKGPQFATSVSLILQTRNNILIIRQINGQKSIETVIITPLEYP